MEVGIAKEALTPFIELGNYRTFQIVFNSEMDSVRFVKEPRFMIEEFKKRTHADIEKGVRAKSMNEYYSEIIRDYSIKKGA